MKVAIVHDDLVQWGGAERVLLGIIELFPEAPIYTLVFDKDHPILSQKFKNKKIITSFLQKLPDWKSYFKATLPLQGLAFEQFDFSQYDLVISQTTRFAKSIITKPGTIHICYCHTPPRFLWNFSGENIAPILQPILSFLRLYDQVSAKRVDIFLAGSKNAQQRIKKIYHQDSQVLYAFVDLEKYQQYQGFDGGYYLIIARLNSYKKVDLAVRVCRKLNKKIKIVGTGPELKNLEQLSGNNVQFLGGLDEDSLVSLIAGCTSLIVPGEEDFGLTPLEAQAMGKPVVAFGKGGALETVVDGRTGVLFDQQSEQSLEQAINYLEKLKINSQDCKDQAAKFSKKKFQTQLIKLVEQAENMLP